MSWVEFVYYITVQWYCAAQYVQKNVTVRCCGTLRKRLINCQLKGKQIVFKLHLFKCQFEWKRQPRQLIFSILFEMVVVCETNAKAEQFIFFFFFLFFSIFNAHKHKRTFWYPKYKWQFVMMLFLALANSCSMLVLDGLNNKIKSNESNKTQIFSFYFARTISPFLPCKFLNGVQFWLTGITIHLHS